ncbi:hypothetical protein [Salinibacter grassmerensis]|uniref:hypothetical protein n=1 Tax=Salinibacter grassmerensis TaxID=3040353 RepID=UPI0021E87E2E|nr:hypothetical protein [Salinibacter grassmerensis]
MNRQELNDRIDNLAQKVLPRKAKEEDGYPVYLDHCFKRIAFDYATDCQWDEKVSRPFKDNASEEQLIRAYTTLFAMAEDPELCSKLNNKSLSHRS